ncbi:MAG: XdhC/CoxI family protein [Acidobacteriia bacterium]|nr:XdhC/CoxI family protein [Terriglobia bacterium]
MDIFEEIAHIRRSGQRAALATIVRVRGSIPSYEAAKILVRSDGSTTGSIGGGCVEAEVVLAAQKAMAEEKSRLLTFDLTDDDVDQSGLICGGTLEVFVEPILAPPTLYIFGAGHVSRAISKVATLAGFQTVVIDDRPDYASRKRFPEAIEIVADFFENAFRKIKPSEFSYLVIVTRGHKEDFSVLRWAIQTPARYIGLIGSRRKIRTLFERLEQEGFDPQLFQRVTAPIGLNIGAITAEEIAVAFVAEIIAVRRRANLPEGLQLSDQVKSRSSLQPIPIKK